MLPPELSIIWNFLLPLHSTCPSPSKPGLHLQTYSAGRLQHSALSTHFPASSGMAHSSISENKNLTLLSLRKTQYQWVERSTWVILFGLNRLAGFFFSSKKPNQVLIWNPGGGNIIFEGERKVARPHPSPRVGWYKCFARAELIKQTRTSRANGSQPLLYTWNTSQTREKNLKERELNKDIVEVMERYRKK